MKKIIFLSVIFTSITYAAGYNGVIYTWGYADVIKNTKFNIFVD